MKIERSIGGTALYLQVLAVYLVYSICCVEHLPYSLDIPDEHWL